MEVSKRRLRGFVTDISSSKTVNKASSGSVLLLRLMHGKKNKINKKKAENEWSTATLKCIRTSSAIVYLKKEVGVYGVVSVWMWGRLVAEKCCWEDLRVRSRLSGVCVWQYILYCCSSYYLGAWNAITHRALIQR